MPHTHRYQQAKRVTMIGALINTLLGISKLFGGIGFHSSALVADGFHSLSDLLTDAMVLVASKYGSQEADESHPYGHQRIETAATYILAILLILTGSAITWDALRHLTQHQLDNPEWSTLPIAFLSIAANEALFWYTRHVGRAIQSDLVIANAWHHRSDAASSLIVFAGLIGSFAGYPALDGVAACVVGLLIIKMGVNYGWKSIKELIDTGVEAKLRLEIKQTIKNTYGVCKVHQLRSRLMGSDIFIDLHVQVDPMISVSEGHYIAQNVHQKLMENIPGVKDVTVHIDPEDDEIHKPSQHLPNREMLETMFIKPWQAQFPEIQTCLLHYLEGKLTIDLIGYITSEKRKQLKHRVNDDLKQHPEPICIRIQCPPEPL
ncbi:MAG: cation diffusion facilitator family transporter [Legionellaceae bacterium]|nr:cation diffusion facilitator family transporter [Legionellaceae bacterium]